MSGLKKLEDLKKGGRKANRTLAKEKGEKIPALKKKKKTGAKEADLKAGGRKANRTLAKEKGEKMPKEKKTKMMEAFRKG